MKQFEMKLLGDTMYCIKVDYYMWSEDKGEYTEPTYLTIDTETKDIEGKPSNLIIFKNEITPNLRVFDKHKEAVEYMLSRISNPCYCENQRVVAIRYNFETNAWEEI